MASSANDGAMPKIFIVFGMPRTGTTYLYTALAQHPQIFVPYRKESHYFSVNYCKGPAWFASLYEGLPAGKIAADINPMYFLDEASIERVLDYDPDVKVILGVREPLDFALSLYGNMIAHGLEVPSILEVVRAFDWPITPHTSLRFSLADGFIERRVRELQARFKDQLLLYDFSYFDHSPRPVMQAIESLLGVDPYFTEANFEKTRINASGRRNPLLLNRLLANQHVLDVLYAILPRGVIRQARRAYERFSARGASANRVAPDSGDHLAISEDERQALRELFSTDTRFYKQLFAERSVF